jgi:hypothetical protein
MISWTSSSTNLSTISFQLSILSRCLPMGSQDRGRTMPPALFSRAMEEWQTSVKKCQMMLTLCQKRTTAASSSLMILYSTRIQHQQRTTHLSWLLSLEGFKPQISNQFYLRNPQLQYLAILRKVLHNQRQSLKCLLSQRGLHQLHMKLLTSKNLLNT